MFPIFEILVTTLEAIGEACGRRKPKTPEEMERQRIQRRNDRAMMFFIVFAAIRASMLGGPLGAEIAPLTGPMYQLFVFFMITDPRTVVRSKQGQVVVVVIVALVEALIRVAGDMGLPFLTPLYASPPLFALCIVGPIALVVDLARSRPPSVAPAANPQPRAA